MVCGCKGKGVGWDDSRSENQRKWDEKRRKAKNYDSVNGVDEEKLVLDRRIVCCVLCVVCVCVCGETLFGSEL